MNIDRDTLLESVLRVLTTSGGDRRAILSRLVRDWPRARAMTCILALVEAHNRLMAGAADDPMAEDEAQWAHAAAHLLTVRADMAEGAGRLPVRLGDLEF